MLLLGIVTRNCLSRAPSEPGLSRPAFSEPSSDAEAKNKDFKFSSCMSGLKLHCISQLSEAACCVSPVFYVKTLQGVSVGTIQPAHFESNTFYGMILACGILEPVFDSEVSYMTSADCEHGKLASETAKSVNSKSADSESKKFKHYSPLEHIS